MSLSGSGAQQEQSAAQSSQSRQAQTQPQKSTNQSPKRAIPNSRNAVLVNSCQRGNPILKEVRNVNWEYADIVPDYVAGSSTGIMFLSLRYHRLHPEYIHMRIERLGAMYQLRILLLMCDVADSEGSIKEVTKTCLINNMTVVIAWSPQQAGHYLSLYLQLDNKPPDSLKEKTPTDYQSIVNNALTTIKGVNKTDVYQLLTRFGSFKNIVKASPDELTKCPGFGDVKVRRMQEAFNYSLKVGVKGQQLSGKNADTGVENKNKNQSQSIQQTGADAGSGVSENQALQQRDGEEIDLLDSDEDALDQVAANFDHSKQDNVSDEQKKQQKQQQEKKEQAVSQHHIHQLHQPNEPSEPSQPEEEIDLLDSDEDALNEVAANFNY